ncbi:flagellar motor switch protein FliN [Acetobacteraceae bacterium ESL0709]|nr:flagellar motor switch protein FliN [Acetobacteraceae bacterium ESL0697]MDF7679059.1 flagellar motor switch protein FliN [Acetobacteraceae bacterium ESL0709]
MVETVKDKKDALPNSEGEQQPLQQEVFTPEEEREAVFDVPVKITAVVGDVQMPVRDLVRLGRGAVVSLNKKLGSAIDIYANGRLIARGEITIVEDDNIAVTMTDIMSTPVNG